MTHLDSYPLTRALITRPRRAALLLASSGLGLLIVLGLLLGGAPADAADAPASGPAATASGAKGGAARPALSVTATRPQSEVWAQKLAANGSIAAWQEASVGAEAAGLRLIELKANVGDVVKRGQLLAVLQSDTLKADQAATRASLAEAQAVLASAEADAARAKALDASGAISAQQIQQQATAAETARARVEALKARLAADELRLAQTRIEAPDAGVITVRNATLGAVVAPGQELFRLIRQGRLEWRAEVPASELVKLKPGSVVSLTGAAGEAVAGRVRLVGPTVDPATRMGLVYVDLARPGALKAGMYARGEFELGRGPVMTLPQSAVLLRDGFSYVFRLNEAGGSAGTAKVALTKVSAGRRQGDRIEISAGLDATASVVASGVGFLADGDTVRLVAAPATAASAPASTSAAPKR